jgi:hypothetical protein
MSDAASDTAPANPSTPTGGTLPIRQRVLYSVASLGSGTFNGPVTNDGMIDLVLGNTASDHLHFNNGLDAGGTLKVDLRSGFNPALGQQFDLFDGSVTGSFTQVQLPSLSDGLRWDQSQLYSDGIIAVAAVPEPTTVGAIGVLLSAALSIRRRSPR